MSKTRSVHGKSQVRKHIKGVHEKRRRTTRARALRAVDLLEKRGERITFASVAEISGVSRPTLYNHPELRALIERKREGQHNAGRRYSSAIGELRAENRKLRKKVENQRSWIEVLNDTGPVMRDDDLTFRLR